MSIQKKEREAKKLLRRQRKPHRKQLAVVFHGIEDKEARPNL